MVTLEAILERNNLNRAYKQVKANRGGPGVDGMTVDEFLDYLRAHAVEIVETVKAGKYKPQPVRRVMIPKEEKGKFRPLGIPTAVDRVIQQAIAQKLSDEYEPVFSLHSHGFRPCRSCRTAIDEALDIANQGYVWVVDLDLSRGIVKARPHQKSKTKCRQRLKAITSRSRGRSLEAYRKELKAFVCGWVNYFAESSMAIFVRSTDEWLRRRIRQIYWKQWKKVRTKFAALRKLGLDDKVAWKWANTRKSYWHTANSWILSTLLTNGRLRELGWTCLGDVYK